MRNATRLSSAERNKVYRERLRAAGGEEVLFKLPSEIVILLDELKERHGLRNRSQALMQLIEHGRAVAQQMA
jgi:transposase